MGYFDSAIQRKEEYLEHHGVKGQHWGIRKYQNSDGSLTEAGKKRYGDKVTMHNGKSNIITGGNKYKTHKEYVTANNFAKGTYLKNKQKIKEQKQKEIAEGKKGARYRAFVKNLDNGQQYNYELNRNRVNAGTNEFKRDVAMSTASKAFRATAVVGAGVVAGMVHAKVLNNKAARESAGALPMNGLQNHYEYKVGAKEVAKYIGKAAALGALYGASSSLRKTTNAQVAVDYQNEKDKKYGGNNSRAKRAAEDEKRWKSGKV